MSFRSLARPMPSTAALVLALFASSAAAYEYLEVGPAGTDSIAWSLNEAGVVVGETDVGGARHAFVRDGSFTIIHPPFGRPHSRATDVNESGEISVTAYGAANNLALLRRGPDWIEVEGKCDAYALNDLGQLVGQCEPDGVFRWWSYRWSPDPPSLENVHPLTGSTQSTLMSIRDDGLACGEAARLVSGGWAREAFCTDGTDIWFLPSLGLPTDTPVREIIAGTGVNDAGLVCGSGFGSDGRPHAFLHDLPTEAMTDLHPLAAATLGSTRSQAHGINAAGDVVGTADGAWGSQPHAVLWQAGAVIDLHEELPDAAVESRAHEIADNGCIVGSWTGSGGDLHAWRLCPDQEEVLLRVTPRSLNLRSRGRWLTGRLRVDPDRVDESSLATCRLGTLALPDGAGPETRIWGRGSRELAVKIDRQALVELVLEHELAEDGLLRIDVCATGTDGKALRGSYLIRVHEQGSERTLGRGRR